MEIEKIIYQTTRSIYSVEDKLSIATVFLFCYNSDSELFAELLYTSDHPGFIDRLNGDYDKYAVDFNIRLSDRNVKECFDKTLAEVIQKYDADGFYKALFNGDPYAKVVADLVTMDFSAVKFREKVENAKSQLTLF